MIILAIDALEIELVEKFNTINLKQEHYGKTDISEFSEPRTMVLWSSFITGENKEDDVLQEGKEMWDKKWEMKKTFFKKFVDPIVIDLPGYSYNKDAHDRSRSLLKKYFETEDKEKIRKEYNKDAFDHHRKIKKEFLDAIGKHDFVLGYFSVVDVIGHLNFGNTALMKMLYKEMDEIAKKCRETGEKLLVISDHGMEAVGMYGDHSRYGFWSTNWESGLKEPKITDFYELLD